MLPMFRAVLAVLLVFATVTGAAPRLHRPAGVICTADGRPVPATPAHDPGCLACLPCAAPDAAAVLPGPAAIVAARRAGVAPGMPVMALLSMIRPGPVPSARGPPAG